MKYFIVLSFCDYGGVYCLSLVFIYCSVMVSGSVLMFVMYLVLLNVLFLESGSGCDGCRGFCLICDVLGVGVFLFCRVCAVCLCDACIMLPQKE